MIITCEQENKNYFYLSSVLVIGVTDCLLGSFKVPTSDFGIWNTPQGIQNVTRIWNPECVSRKYPYPTT